MPKEELPAKPTWPAIIQLLPILLLWAIWTWLSKYVFLPIIVFDKEPLSIVEPHPISQCSFIITIPIWGYLIFLVLSGKKLQNNHYLFVGYNKNNNDEWNEISVIKTDPKFNVIWSKNYGANNYDCKGYEVIEKNDDEYWILGYTKASKNNVLLLKINGNGEEKWFSYLPDIKCTFASHMLKNKSIKFKLYR